MGIKITPDDFKKDPGRFVENQGGHMALGAASAIFMCGFMFLVFGEFPRRSVVFAVIALFYIVRVELIGQGWKGWDTIEDALFVAVYGAGPVLYAFHEIEAGSSLFIGDIFDVFPFVVAAFLHLALGAAWREFARRRASVGEG